VIARRGALRMNADVNATQNWKRKVEITLAVILVLATLVSFA
jgi:hypothetical protein